MKSGKKRMIKYLSAALASLTLLPALAVLLPGIKADMPDGMEILSAEDCGDTVVPLGTSYEAVRASLPKETTVKVASVSAAAAQTLYTAEMNRSDWTLFDSDATSFAAEKFAAVSSSAKMMALTGGEYEDFVIEAKLKGTSEAIDNNFGVMLRATNVTGKNSDAYLGYYVGIGKYGGADALTIGYSENKWHLIKTVSISYQTGKEYTLKVLLYGNRLAVWIDGNLLYQSTLSGGVPAYGKGRVGLRTYKQLFECSSFTVRTASGSELNEAEAVPSVTATAPLGEWYGENYDPDKPGRYVFKAKIASSQREVKASVTVSALKEFTESVSLVPYTDVTINGGFFRDYIKQTVCVILPAAIANVEKPTGGIPNIKNAAKKNRGEPYSAFSGALYVDSDVHKVLESMCYALSADAAGDAEILSAQARIRAKLEEWIPYYIDAQEQSGYFDTYYTLGGMEKYTDITKHELYCMGHFIEAAIAHCESTGGKDTRLFDMAVKCADHLVSTFGYGAGQRKQIAGHQEIEIALLALARYAAAAEDPSLKLRSGRYADLAAFFLEVRGDYADRTVTGDKKPYRQDHAPVSEQVSAVGHAVRAEYMYTAMAELAAIDEEYAKKYDKALTALWKDVSETKQYITGGVGQSAANEGFADAYDLYDLTSYCETCAGIANMMWNRSMGKLYLNSVYADKVETDLYNTVLGCVNFEGNRFFYRNTLASMTGLERNEWYGTACCPPNFTRTILSLGGYLYKTSGDCIYIDQFITNSAEIKLSSGVFSLQLESAFPWNGDVSFVVSAAPSSPVAVSVRVPGWSSGAFVKINGAAISVSAAEDGYIRLERVWKSGDTAEIRFSMETQYESSPDQVKSNAGCVALRRGPLVYLAEAADNDFDVFSAYIDVSSPAEIVKVESLDGKTDPYGVRDMNLIKQKGTTDSPGGSAAVVWTFIPFYARANRGKGAMIVHVPTEPRAHASLEAYAVPSASYTYNGDSVYHLNDGTDNAAKRWTSYKSATSVISDPWVQYDFSYEVDVSACLIRWYRDSSGVSLPDSFTIYYRDTATGKYRPVTGQDSDRITYGSVNEYTFREVRTDSIRIEMKNAVSGKAVGIIEWKLVGSVVSVPLETDAPPETGTEPASSASGTAAVPSDGAPGSERKKTAAAIAASAAAAAAAVGVTLAVTAKKKRAKKKD